MRPLGYLRLLRARHRYFDTLRLGLGGPLGLTLKSREGYQRRMWRWRNRYAGRRCFILGNGPSLAQTDVWPLRREITIGLNAVYKLFEEWGFKTTYLLLEDIEQTELRGPDLPFVRGLTKLAALYNAYAFAADRETFFFNARLGNPQYWRDMAPRFSRDFADIVYLGSTVTYIALQLAHYLGCGPVYLVGVDHDYGELAERFPPGKITITEENAAMVRTCHFNAGYYEVGDVIGVPDVKRQNEAYAEARRVFEEDGRRVYNATLGGKLEAFERVDYGTLF